MSAETWLLIAIPVSIFAIIIGYVIAKLMRSEELYCVGLFTRMGTGSWKFNESWASTLTAVGAILGLIIAAEVVPEQPRTFSTTTYIVLNLMFGATIVVANLLYNAIRWPHKVDTFDKGKRVVNDKGEPVTVTENQGFVVVFLSASALVLWALLGQLITTWYLLGEIGSLPTNVDMFFSNLVRLSAILAIVYGTVSIPWTLINQVNRRNKDWILP